MFGVKPQFFTIFHSETTIILGRPLHEPPPQTLPLPAQALASPQAPWAPARPASSGPAPGRPWPSHVVQGGEW
jgi:hypothetical protein